MRPASAENGRSPSRPRQLLPAIFRPLQSGHSSRAQSTRDGVDLDRSTLADWVGQAAWVLDPIVESIRAHEFTADKIHGDDTPVPVLAPDTGRTKTGRHGVYARDDRPFCGTAPPAAAFFYSPDRKGERPQEHLNGFTGFLQAVCRALRSSEPRSKTMSRCRQATIVIARRPARRSSLYASANIRCGSAPDGREPAGLRNRSAEAPVALCVADETNNSMKRSARIAAWSLGVVGVLALGVTGAVHLLQNSEFVRGQVAARFSGFSGKKTTIGKLSIDWGATSHVHLTDVAIANASWGKAAHMMKAEEIDFDIRLWPLLRGDVELPQLSLRKPEIHLESNDKDQSNWSVSEAPVTAKAANAVKPKERHQTPLIGRLEIVEGRIGYSDLKRKLDLEGTVSTATGKADADPQAELTLKGNLQKQLLTVHFVGGSALMLRDTDKPYPVDLDVTYGETRLKAKGTLQDPLQWKGADVQLSLAGPDLSDIFPLLGIPGPPTPPYQLSGRLDHSPAMWRVDDLKWHAGDSDLAGDITIDQHPKPSHLTAKLTSEHLAFKDLAPLIGASPGKQGNVSKQQKETAAKTEAEGNLFPDTPLQVERLRAMSMDVSLDARHVVAPEYLPVQALYFHVLVENGEADVQPLKMAFGGGSISGSLNLDARADVPKVRTALEINDIELAAFFRGTRYFDTTKGLIRGQVKLAGSGRSLAQIMGGADGHAVLAMAGGNVSNLMVSLAGLQLADALALYVTGDNRIPLRCALGRIDVANGNATLQKTIVDTQKSVLHIEGHAGLSDQVVKLKLTADPKHFDLLDLHAPVLMEGKLSSPKVSIDRALPIPTPVIGSADDVQCDALTKQLLSPGTTPG